MAAREVTLRRISPWTMLRISGAVSIVGFLAWMVAVALLYLVFQGMGFWGRFDDLLGGDSGLGAGWVFLTGALVGLLWALVVTALMTIGALVYNACADLVGGLTVTLSDDAVEDA